MVKDSKTRKPRPPINADGSPRRKPGKPPRPGDVRTDRLVMRVHHDLLELLTERARERGITRSNYVEQLLVGWVRLDPRNRQVDLIGKYLPNAPHPYEVQVRSPFAFAERWQKFATVSRLILGAEPPREWIENEDRGLVPNEDPRVPGRHYDDLDLPEPPPSKPRRR